MKSRSLFSKILFFGVPLTTTTVLGIWQLKRYNWKVEQMEIRKETLNMEPIEFTKDIS
jgi:cytochrome oxidase assembly protein ShyY1